MAKPIKGNPIIRGRAAKQFKNMFLSKSYPSPERVEQNKKDVEVFLSTRDKLAKIREKSHSQKEISMAKKCPGSKIQSGGRGRGMGVGKGNGPVGRQKRSK